MKNANIYSKYIAKFLTFFYFDIRIFIPKIEQYVKKNYRKKKDLADFIFYNYGLNLQKQKIILSNST